MAFTKVVLDVSKTENKKRVSVGSVEAFIPTLEDFGIKAVASKELSDEGLPTYDDKIHQWLQDAITASTKAQARNRLVPASTALKNPAQPIATNFEQLTAESQGNTGAGLALIREVGVKFTAYVNGLGKSEALKNTLISLFNKREFLKGQNADVKAKFTTYVEEFAASLDKESLAKYERPLENILAIASEANDASSLLDD